MAQDKVRNRVYEIHAATPVLLLGWRKAIPLPLASNVNGGTLIVLTSGIRTWNLWWGSNALSIVRYTRRAPEWRGSL